MLAAIETAAQERPPVVDGATLRPQIDAGAVAGGEEIDRITFTVRKHLVLVRRDIIAMVRMEEEALIAAAAFDTVATRNVGLVSGRQILL